MPNKGRKQGFHLGWWIGVLLLVGTSRVPLEYVDFSRGVFVVNGFCSTRFYPHLYGTQCKM